MEILTTTIQLIIPLGIINVWLLRQRQATAYRGGDAPNLKAEFAAYGLPEWVYYAVGTLKLSAAGMLLLGFLVPVLVLPGAAIMSVLMLGAVAMHAKVRDAAIRYLPATLMLILSLLLIFLQ
jgi:uncharacterized membrane protein YphA (DoxX/SURF4 family)